MRRLNDKFKHGKSRTLHNVSKARARGWDEDAPKTERMSAPDWKDPFCGSYNTFCAWVDGRVGHHWDKVYGDLKRMVPARFWEQFRPFWCGREQRWELGRCYFDEEGVLRREEARGRGGSVNVSMGAKSPEAWTVVHEQWEVESGEYPRTRVTAVDSTRYVVVSPSLVYRLREGRAWEEVTPEYPSSWGLHSPFTLVYYEGTSRTLSRKEKTRLGLSRYESGPARQHYVPLASEGPRRAQENGVRNRPPRRERAPARQGHELPAPPTWGPTAPVPAPKPLGRAVLFYIAGELASFSRRAR